MKRYFTFQDEKSNKFWAVEVQNQEMTVIFGKTGEDDDRFLALVPLLDYPEIEITDIENDLYLKNKFPKLWKKFSGG